MATTTLGNTAPGAFPARQVQRVVTYFVTDVSHVREDSYRDLFGNNRTRANDGTFRDGTFVGWTLKGIEVVGGNGVKVFNGQTLVALIVATFEAPAGTPWNEQHGGL